MQGSDSPSGLQSCWSIVVAGGSGNRYGGRKQFDPLRGRRVIDWSVDALGTPGRTVVVVPADELDQVAAPFADDVVVVPGGDSRSASVRAGLAAVDPAAEFVLVHDAARPLVPVDVVWRVVEALATDAPAGQARASGVIPVVPVTDTIRRRDGGAVDRSDLVAVQTPQGFVASALRAAHGREEDATDDATLVQRAGGAVVHVAGDPANFKITVPSDLAQAEAVLAERSGGDPVADLPEFRIGQGFDVHPWTDDPERTLTLGGVEFPDARALTGHSDADPIAHAVTDALLGACGVGDIGTMFPDTDPSLAGADSVELLRRAAEAVAAEGWRVVNADVTVIIDAPKLAPHRATMIERISAAVSGAPVSIKGKRTEGVAGLGGGVQSHAVVLMCRDAGGAGPERPDEETR